MSENEAEPLAGRIAVVGMAVRFPGAVSISDFWENLCQGRECIETLSRDELLQAGVSAATAADPGYVPRAALLGDISGFDAGLFGISAREAELLDPQHRLFLECAWAAQESAGLQPSERGANTGVFAGSSQSSYLLFNLHQGLDPSGADLNLATLVANDKDYLATRVAWHLNLRGPAVNVQTACSTSLVATHLACQSLLNYECDSALAGGVTVRVPHRVGYLHQGGSMLSKDGHCRPFDARAGGTLPGSGAGVVVLRRLEDALEQGDHIHAVILGSAVNNDGGSKVGFTAPNVRGQASVIASAQEVAGVEPRSIGMVEAHGTATALGDPVEIEALTRAFCGSKRGVEKPWCAIGSVKSNFGHLESAAGVAGLIKAVLAVERGQIPPSLHFEEPNPKIDFGASPVFVNTELRPWGGGGFPRRAGVSSFGFGGTNCHLILEAAPVRPRTPERGQSIQLVPLSARTRMALSTMVNRLSTLPEEGNGGPSLSDVAFTMSTGRRHLHHRMVFCAPSRGEFIKALKAVSAGTSSPLLSRGSGAGRASGGIGMFFAGQAKWSPAAFRAMRERERAFDRSIQDSDVILRAYNAKVDIPDGGAFADPASLFAVEFAVAEALRSYGVTPSATLGQGIGELVAACVAEVIRPEEVLRWLALNSRVVAEWRPVGDGVVVASTVHLHGLAEVASDDKRMERSELSKESLFDVLFEGTGRHGRDGMLRQRVKMQTALRELDSLGCSVWSGPLSIDQSCPLTAPGALQGDRWIPLSSAGDDAHEHFLRGLAQMHCAGVEVNWVAFYAHRDVRRTPLPTYPFEHRQYWLSPAKEAAPGLVVKQPHPLVSKLLDTAGSDRVFPMNLHDGDSEYLLDHKVAGAALLPAAAFVESLLVAASASSLENFRIAAPLPVDGRRVQVVVSHREDEQVEVTLHSRTGTGDWVRHASARVGSGEASSLDAAAMSPRRSIEEIQAGCPQVWGGEKHYASMKQVGLDYGPAFRGLKSVHFGSTESLGEIEVSPALAKRLPYKLHPAVLDACLQAAAPLMLQYTGGELLLPVEIGQVRFARALPSQVWSHCVRRTGTKKFEVDLSIYDKEGLCVAQCLGVGARGASHLPLHALVWRQTAIESAPLLEPSRGTWLIAHPPSEERLVEDLRSSLESSGNRCISAVSKLGEEPLAGMVYYCGASGADPELTECQRLMAAVRARSQAAPCRLWIVTRGASSLFGASPSPAASAVWSLGRVIAEEYPEFECVLLDTGDDPSCMVAKSILSELAQTGVESQVAFRQGLRFCARLVRSSAVGENLSVPSSGDYRVEVGKSGLLSELKAKPLTLPAPGRAEVLIRVQATGLNFRDLLKALGSYPGPATPLGDEVAGVVEAVGADVLGLAPGMSVVAAAAGGLGSRVVVSANGVRPRPRNLSPAMAAALPVAFVTASYALQRVVRLKKGQRVLIHAAAGGVGSAAVAIALHLGAVVFATAGSERKRRWLRNRGVFLALNSRSTDYLPKIRENTGGEGVDVVINCLNGRHIAASVDAVAEGGHFVELGRLGVWSSEQVSKRRPDVHYTVVALEQTFREEPDLLGELLGGILARTAGGEWELPPVRQLPVGRCREALRVLQNAQHIGKLVLVHEPDESRCSFRSDSCYLVTGGTGGLGPVLARELLRRGAGQVVVVSRWKPDLALLESISKEDGRVAWRSCDVSDLDAVQQLVGNVHRKDYPLRGVFHAAATVVDGQIVELGADTFTQATAAKVAGAWNLHRATNEVDLDHFVLFSSISALLPRTGQASYAAANGYLDGLARLRRFDGLPGFSVALGPVGAGMSQHVSEASLVSLQSSGVSVLEPVAAMRGLVNSIGGAGGEAGVLLATVDWAQLALSSSGEGTAQLFSEMVEARSSSGSSARGELAQVLESLSDVERLERLEDEICRQAAVMLGRSTSNPVNATRSLLDQGLDSLMAVELRNALGVSTGLRLPSTLIFDQPTAGRLAGWIVRKLFGATPPAQEVPRDTHGPEPAMPEGEDELAALIDGELDRWKKELRHGK